MAQSNLTSLPYGDTYGGDAPLNYERFFVPVIPQPLGEELIRLAALEPGERVLDVACGTGIIARLAIERVGPSGSVAGLDLNPGMLALARTLVKPEASTRWYESSAESIPIPDQSFDVIFCQLGLQFVPGREAALEEMHRVLAPNGRLLFNVPRPSRFFDVLDEAMAHHVGPMAAQFVRAVFSMSDPASIERLVEDAGFRDVVARSQPMRIQLPPAKEFLWQYIHATPLTAELAKRDTATHTALEREVVEKWKPWATEGGLAYEQEIIVVTARK